MMFKSLNGLAPVYLRDLFHASSNSAQALVVKEADKFNQRIIHHPPEKIFCN